MTTYELLKTIEEKTFCLTIQVTSSTNLPLEIFVWQFESFSHLASVKELLSIEPQGTIGTSFRRESKLRKEFKTTTELEKYLNVLQPQIKQLEIDYKATLDELEYNETVEVSINEDI